MLKDRIEHWYIDEDCNCAESMLHAISEEYSMNFDHDDMTMVSAFGGGFGSGLTCGAMAASMAALGRMCVKTRAHATEGFMPMCGEYAERFKNELSSTECCVLKAKNFQEGRRCIKTVHQACDCFEAFLKEKGISK